MDINTAVQRMWMGLDGELGKGSTYGDKELYSARICSAFRSKSTKMGDIEYATIFNMSELWNG